MLPDFCAQESASSISPMLISIICFRKSRRHKTAPLAEHLSLSASAATQADSSQQAAVPGQDTQAPAPTAVDSSCQTPMGRVKVRWPAQPKPKPKGRPKKLNPGDIPWGFNPPPPQPKPVPKDQRLCVVAKKHEKEKRAKLAAKAARAARGPDAEDDGAQDGPPGNEEGY
eukprot:NODE_5422_length_707_cov_19.050152_g4569_i0.p2 GENE.NODE_5422_length_707_cov_19.050152_g4569_i0~~NODE_5422_length_707_cov_19.050152_g4569_i0.p2  ORF type:complete len:170 (+),score=19.63 NODE_5422_length_707_cov_19.050152_g4569_i0:148-657(+)